MRVSGLGFRASLGFRGGFRGVALRVRVRGLRWPLRIFDVRIIRDPHIFGLGFRVSGTLILRS